MNKISELHILAQSWDVTVVRVRQQPRRLIVWNGTGATSVSDATRQCERLEGRSWAAVPVTYIILQQCERLEGRSRAAVPVTYIILQPVV